MRIIIVILAILLGSGPRGHIDKEHCMFVFDNSNTTIELYGKVRIVDIGETFRVRVVDIGEDVLVKVRDFPSECGEWRFVDIGEDFSIKIVDIGEDFTIRFYND